MSAIQPDLSQVHEAGEQLLELVGAPEKPEVETNVEEVDTTWGQLNVAWTERQRKLDEALHKATSFQDELMVRARKKRVWMHTRVGG